tara:strand:+ start:8018 stop:9259 length:1242 start_codon:yes stop_codon:yes gene_type:complete
MGMAVFAQKSELKTAEKAIKSNDFSNAMTALNQAEGLIGSADEKTKAKFYYLKGIATYQNGANSNIEEVGAAFNQLINYEKESNTSKYSSEIGELMNTLVQNIAAKATDDYGVAIESKLPEDYIKAAKGFSQVFLLSPADTTFLDNSALVYYYAQDYETSKDIYEKLLDLNYTGITTIYIAENIVNGEETTYPDKKRMDLDVKLGVAKNPRVEVKESRRETIFKNLAQDYDMLGNSEKALEVIAEGRKEFPESYTLLIDEANMYYKAGDNAKFKEKLEEAISLNPTEPTLYYNVGVMNMDQKNTDEAIKFFEKAIELKPDYSDAYNNIGAAIIEKAAPIIEEMNKSLSDFDKYDKLQNQQFEIYKLALPSYEKAYELSPKSLNIIQTLMGLYENLEMTDKLEEIKIVYDQLKE